MRNSFFFTKSKSMSDEAMGSMPPFERRHLKHSATKILSSYSGLTDREVGSLQQRFGPNKYSVPRRSYLRVLFGQLLSPFFVFQVFCISLWALDEYWYYSLVTLAMILVFEMTVSIQRYRSFQEMEQMLKGPYSVCVYRNNAWVQVSSHHLVPGDLIDVKSTFLDGGAGKTFPCDAVLLNGSVLVNEAMLTGESDYKWKTSCEANTDSKEGLRTTCFTPVPLLPCPKSTLNNNNLSRARCRHKKRKWRTGGCHRLRKAKQNSEGSLCCILHQDGVHDEGRGNHA